MSLTLLRELDSPFMADVWCEALEQAGIPHLLRTYQDTAYGGLYITQRGYGSLYVEDEWLDRAAQVDKDLEASISPVPFDAASLARKLDYNLADPMAGQAELDEFLQRCLEMGCAAACVSPWLVGPVAEKLEGSVVATCGLIGYPFGGDTAKTKRTAAREAALAGARELEFVLNRGLAARGKLEQAVAEVQEVAEGASGIPLKVVLEVSRMDPELCKEAALALAESQAVSYLKTGSGFYGPASLEQISGLREVLGMSVGIKAEGGVNSVEDILAFCEAGAGRIGSDKAYELWREARKRWPDQD